MRAFLFIHIIFQSCSHIDDATLLRRPTMQAPLQARNDSDAAQTDTSKTVAQKRGLADNRPEAVVQRKLADIMNNSPRVLQKRASSDGIHNSPRMVAQRHEMNTLFGGAVKPQQYDARPAEASSAQSEEKTNNTGLPNELKSGIESLSGMSMGHVRVHYNSDKPAQLQAHAYAHGNEIHLGSGQERHLPHEAWHVVQQAQGRVQPSRQLISGMSINDHVGLEREADVMGARALQLPSLQPPGLKRRGAYAGSAVQRRLKVGEEEFDKVVLNKKAYRVLRDKHDVPPFDIKQRKVFGEMIWDTASFEFSDWKEAKLVAARLGRMLGETRLGNAYKYYTSGANKQRKTIKQPGYATGDQFGIAAAMIIDPNIDVMVSKGRDGDPTDRADDIKKFYLDSGIDPIRIHVIGIEKLRDGGATEMNDGVKGRYEQHFGLVLNNTQAKKYSEPVGYGTTHVAARWTNDARDKVRQAWDVNSSKDTQIKAWLATKHIPDGGESVAVLWSRFSGKRGDIHIEHDTSYEGIRQIVAEIKDHYTAVIIAGDSGTSDAKKDKFKKIATEGGENVFDLTEFWKEKTPELKAWGGNTRFGQFKLYDYLHRKYKALRHLGMRSGNLEAMAMLGHKVRYMEEPGSKGAERMEKWHDDKRNPILPNVSIGYERLLIDEVPTRSGKYFKNTRHRVGDLTATVARQQEETTAAKRRWTFHADHFIRDMVMISGNLSKATKPKTIARLNARAAKLEERQAAEKNAYMAAVAKLEAAQAVFEVATSESADRPAWAPRWRTRKSEKPIGVKSLPKGFRADDLRKIRSYLLPLQQHEQDV
ncbi:DUF4157 domain-containing protein [Herbaspirillum rubrisubalbicans Os34]|uniref:DUF4157 domain-containing protein n=2 Tax=Herbaspirillum rubrisubalbicans TaxID=80842 RepID=A0A6M3ZS78_9BURK|nr:DUF4157 domain-containing protein [Herbaspirillum rubrisubalbicans Os34]